jgi:hypothetical protein
MGFLEIALIIGIPLGLTRLSGWPRTIAAAGILALLAVVAVIAAVLFGQETRFLFPAAAVVLAWFLPPPASRS